MSSEVHWADTDMLQFKKVNRNWSPEQLLAEKGWFPLADVMKKVDPKKTGKYRKILALRDRFLKENEDPVAIMGLKQFGNRIWADMPQFSYWYMETEQLKVNRIPKHWDLATFLAQKNGIFSLKGVLQLLPDEWPIKYPAMKNLIQKQRDSREEIGADKLDGTNYVVFMPKFGEWILKQMS